MQAQPPAMPADDNAGTAGGEQPVDIFTDGACKGNPGAGGWGALLQCGSHEKELFGGEAHTTNNRMELLAVIRALDALTRIDMQALLEGVWQDLGFTALMVTHDVDEALLLSDRIVMLTNGPEARIGQILDVRIPRPRLRMEVVNQDNVIPLEFWGSFMMRKGDF